MLLDLVGIALSVIGLTITIVQVRKARSAAEAARTAVLLTRDDMLRMATVISAEQVLAKLKVLLERLGSSKTLGSAATLCIEINEMLARAGSGVEAADGEMARIFNERTFPAVSEMVSLKRVDSALLQQVRASVMDLQQLLIAKSGRQQRALSAPREDKDANP